MASRGRHGGAPAREDEPRREERAEQQAPAPQGPVLPPPPPVDYGVFMQGLVQAMQMPAHTQAALQAQLEVQPSLRTRLVAFDHRTLDEALSAACRQKGEMQQYLEEKKASQKRPAGTFQRQDKKKAMYQAPQRLVTTNSAQENEGKNKKKNEVVQMVQLMRDQKMRLQLRRVLEVPQKWQELEEQWRMKVEKEGLESEEEKKVALGAQPVLQSFQLLLAQPEIPLARMALTHPQLALVALTTQRMALVA
ncbi:hypothetical protein Taro_037407 [Colocasia esculenta]|uniref:Uncharacterized protein n=1 Tax=Colocasia esculenta TaxID=4460 RepID=A0A843W0F1_COLES|nr:hypothetical protein [Colocasia esculenta]